MAVTRIIAAKPINDQKGESYFALHTNNPDDADNAIHCLRDTQFAVNRTDEENRFQTAENQYRAGSVLLKVIAKRPLTKGPTIKVPR